MSFDPSRRSMRGVVDLTGVLAAAGSRAGAARWRVRPSLRLRPSLPVLPPSLRAMLHALAAAGSAIRVAGGLDEPGRNDLQPGDDDAPDSAATKTILIVDDEADITLTLKAYMELHDYSVVVAYDGLEALRKVEAARPDLVITDITMPRMDGVELVERLRELPDCDDLPVIVISAHNRRCDLPYFRKPFDPKALLSEVRRLVG